MEQQVAKGLVMGQLTIHNVIRRNFDKIAQFEVESSEEQQKTFVDTCSHFMNLIHGHHSTEEDVWFPTFSKKSNINLDNFVSDHQEFEKIWKETDMNLTALHASYNGTDAHVDRAKTLAHVKHLFKQMQDEMLPHLQLEENTITLERIVEHFTVEDMHEAHKNIMAHAMQHMDQGAFGLFLATLTPEERAMMQPPQQQQQQQQHAGLPQTPEEMAKGLIFGMMTIHNVLRRNFDNIAQFNLDSPEEQQKVFVETSRNFMNVIHGHHSTEEDVWFPTICKKANLDMEKFVDDHKEFNKLWNEANENLSALHASYNSTDTNVDRAKTLAHVKHLFKQMQDDMLPHLQSEETSITAELFLKNFSFADMLDLHEKTMEHAMKHMDQAAFGLFLATMSNEEKAVMLPALQPQQQQHGGAPQTPEEMAKGLIMGQSTIHNVLRRNFENISNFDLESSEDQKKTFVDTCRTFMNVIHGHHSTEEDIWFPTVCKKAGLDLNKFVDDHKEFDKLWKETNENLEALNASYNGTDVNLDRTKTLAHVKHLFKLMQEDMLPHLQLEESTITVDVIAKSFTVPDMHELHGKVMEHAMKHMDQAAFGLFLASLTPEEKAMMQLPPPQQQGGPQPHHH